MPKPTPRAYSAHAREAVHLLGSMIRAGRLERKMTAQELAERIGVSRGFVQRMEGGDMRCEIGAFMEAAHIVGVPLFGVDERDLRKERARIDDRLSLLPRAARKPRKVISDDF
jgi:transcriptional regulator with XRE-family HTH domain